MFLKENKTREKYTYNYRPRPQPGPAKELDSQTNQLVCGDVVGQLHDTNHNQSDENQ